MKKILSILLMMIMVLGLAACSGGDGDMNDEEVAESGSSVEAVSVVGMTFELYKTNYGEEKETDQEIVYTFKDDGTVDVNLMGTDMNKPFTQDGANVTIDFGANGGEEALELIDGELVKDLGYGKEYFRQK